MSIADLIICIMESTLGQRGYNPASERLGCQDLNLYLIKRKCWFNADFVTELGFLKAISLTSYTRIGTKVWVFHPPPLLGALKRHIRILT